MHDLVVPSRFDGFDAQSQLVEGGVDFEALMELFDDEPHYFDWVQLRRCRGDPVLEDPGLHLLQDVESVRRRVRCVAKT